MSDDTNGYTLSRAEDARWEPGRRDCFEQRNLRLEEPTSGAFRAQVIRARNGGVSEPLGKHKHDVMFHWCYVLSGWIEMDLKDVGPVRLEKGDCHYMPKGIPHEIVGCSDDLELIEVHGPGRIDEQAVPDWNG
ncbi:MAG: cupin domain-containing protein [Hyphomicrobiales bacterium]|nr:cupin domain-containing protein [Hyphomicrobiales bacterium]